MITRRYFSHNLRSAVLAVKDELGSNAVILSQNKSLYGVEVIAAVAEECHANTSIDLTPDYLNKNSEIPGDLDHNDQSIGCCCHGERVYFYKTGTGAQNANIDQAQFSNGNDSCTKQRGERQAWIGSEITNHAPESTVKHDRVDSLKIPTNEESLTKHRMMDSVSMNKVVAKEEQDKQGCGSVVENQNGLSKLMALIEQQITEHAWGEVAKSNPLRARLIRQLLKLDIHPLIIQRVTDAISGDQLDAKSILPHALALIANQLPIYKEDVTACGGTVALFGATGAGKTTTIAKMAARFALRHGRDQVALITTDSQRIAAHEQLRIYSDILGISFRMAGDATELLNALSDFSEKPFVLIDTAGMSSRDIQFSNYYQLFSGVLSQVKNFLVLPATAHRSVLEQSAQAFRAIKLDGSIITKVDETVSLGGPLSVAVLNNLPIAYYSDGQKIPDDFHLARAHNLVSRAVGVADQPVETQTMKAKSQDKAGIEANVSI
ncbi:flagellar biosynthesis protein FlhF [Kaarinaea lacus]